MDDRSEGQDLLLNEVLDALGEGRLAVEDALRPLLELEGARALATQLLRSAEGHDRRRMHLRRPLSREVLERAGQLFDETYGQHPNVVDWHWGKPLRSGLKADGVGLVVHVATKVPESVLDPEFVLPRSLSMTHDGKEYEIPVDVQVTDVCEKHGGSARTGRGSVVVGDRRGTLSAVLSPVSGACDASAVVISGHVAQGEGNRAHLHDFSGREVFEGSVSVCREDEELDFALIENLSAGAVQTLQGNEVEIRDVDASLNDLFVTMHVVDAEPMGAFIDGVNVSAAFAHGRMKGLIRVSKGISRPGYSGAPVTDEEGALIGFVIGVNAKKTRTYLISARKVIDALPS